MAQNGTQAIDHSPEVKEFWDALRDGKFLVRRCTDCKRAHWYPRGVCPYCFSGRTEWVTGSGRGRIYTYSVMRRVPRDAIGCFLEISILQPISFTRRRFKILFRPVCLRKHMLPSRGIRMKRFMFSIK